MYSECCIKATPETSPIIQELAFKYGYRWGVQGKLILYTERPYLYFWSDKTICYANRNHDNSLELDLFQLLKFFQTGKLPPKTFHVNDCKVEVDGDEVTITRMGNDPLTLDIETLKEIVNVI